MKVLYAFQGTGNGHVARAQEIVPILKKHVQVDTLISGHQSQLKSNFTVDFKYKGVSLLYNKAGGLSYRKTFLENNFFEAAKNIMDIDLSQYDLIINDFEPLTGWASRFNSVPIIELSHQASFGFKETPKPKTKNFLGELVLNNYVPCVRKIGFHFENYHVQIKKPVIRGKIRDLYPTKRGYYMVYLPSFSNENIMHVLKKIPVEWKVFTKNNSLHLKEGNVEIFPIDEIRYLEYFENCEGILCSAGFETPAEALFMEKKLFVIPIRNQYEQECNACALDQLGIPNSKTLNDEDIMKWVATDFDIKVNYPNVIEEILLNEVLTF
ncbi:glycosyl transferase [Chryseobacterium sp. SNU WT5]|uniref:glycosyltransferase family protein n=1 Tax=Chryseobacterium sp. SNU WT5 TaxID=2594269 RepID=UPI001181510C|nr:glycosyltransferase family protein [Chryseobacterium sp. SNU WT5]QDP85721.1 glycosyl transferase [Chryseobacterium sp. SNU WT5]